MGMRASTMGWWQQEKIWLFCRFFGLGPKGMHASPEIIAIGFADNR